MKATKPSAPRSVVDKARSLRASRGRIVAMALAIPLSIFALAQSIGALAGPAPLAVLPMLLVLAVLMRAQENLVHELSHRNVFKSPTVSELFGIFAAGSLLIDFIHYRTTHRWHHSGYGTDRDPCLARMHYAGAEMGLLSYMREHFASLAKARSLTIVLYLSWLLLIAASGGVASTLAYLTAQFLLLPVIRRNAEAAEHDYRKDEFHGTFTSLGSRKFLHPLGDGYHLLHHMFPYVPGTSLGELHRYALIHWPEYAQAQSLRAIAFPQQSFPNKAAT